MLILDFERDMAKFVIFLNVFPIVFESICKINWYKIFIFVFNLHFKLIDELVVILSFYLQNLFIFVGKTIKLNWKQNGDLTKQEL